MESSISSGEGEPTSQVCQSDTKACKLMSDISDGGCDNLQSAQVSSSCDACENKCTANDSLSHNCSQADVVSSSAEVVTPPISDDDNEEEEEEEENDCAQLLANLELSESTMMALQEFLHEEQERKDKLKLVQEGNIPEEFEENWNLSQFWYSQATAKCLAKECLRLASASGDGTGSIACIASPTLYRSLRGMQPKVKVSVFEFDSRFAVYGEDFVLYDYRSPLSVPVHLRDSFDVIVADPPYLEEDCLTKVALTIKMVSKPDAKIILCTGKVMEELAAKLMDLKLQNFEIRHEKERLSNPFGCFSNYDLDKHCKYRS